MEIKTVGDMLELSKMMNYIQLQLLIEDLVYTRHVHSLDDSKDVLRKYYYSENKKRTAEHIRRLLRKHEKGVVKNESMDESS